MAELKELTDIVKQDGYSELNAEAKVCQDVILAAIAKSSLSRSVTIKGGVVMRSITGNIRRATQDMDFDFIRYSLSEESIRAFIKKLNCLDGIRISISGDIEELSQQEYKGKRVYITIEDDAGQKLMSKIDLGVHKNIQIEQEEYCFDVCLDEVGASLLINSKEQIFTEKLRSLLRFGPLSTRYKDIYDMCYLCGELDRDKLRNCLDTYIFSDTGMRENNTDDILKRLNMTFSNRLYRRNIKRTEKANWLNIDPYAAFERITSFFSDI